MLSQHMSGNQNSPMQSASGLGPRQPALAGSSPAKYIASALRFSPTGDQPRATGLLLTISNSGARHKTLEHVYLERTAALNEAFEQHGHRWPLFPVDAPTYHLPFTLTIPATQSVADKLHQQELRIVNQINSYTRHQLGKLYLDTLGDREYEGASAAKFDGRALQGKVVYTTFAVVSFSGSGYRSRAHGGVTTSAEMWPNESSMGPFTSQASRLG
jgi:hypothetical protein